MVAFKHSLSAWGQGELRAVIRRRVERFAAGVRELQELTYGDRQTVGLARYQLSSWSKSASSHLILNTDV